MGRSVSVASGAFAVGYQDVSWMGYRDEDSEGNKIENPEYDEDLGSMDWEDWLDNIKAEVRAMFPSFEECDQWLDREDHAVLENRFAYFGISEYCGLVSVWLVLKDDLAYGYRDQDCGGLATNWARQVKPKFENKFSELRKIGTFSNGEAVYERKEK